jgi:Na+-driven multidrug efflux pump
MGLRGAGLAALISECMNLIMAITYCAYFDSNRYFQGLTSEPPFKDNHQLTKNYLFSAYPIITHLYIDHILYNALIMTAMQLGTAAMNCQIIFFNVSGFYYKMAISLATVLMTYIGTYMGASNHRLS